MTVKCCRCGKVRDAAGAWTEAQVADQEISHTYCGECLLEELRLLEVYREFMREEAVAA